jgi:hypothetical protein
LRFRHCVEGLPAELRFLSLQTLLWKKSPRSCTAIPVWCAEKDRSRAGRGTIRVPSIKSRRFHGIHHVNKVPRRDEVLDHSPVGLLNCDANSSLPGPAAYASRQYTPISLKRESSLGNGVDMVDDDNDDYHVHSYTGKSECDCHVFL